MITDWQSLIKNLVAAAENAMAIGTLLLATATFFAVFIPRHDEKIRRHDDAHSAARLLRRALSTFERRMNKLAHEAPAF